jgi:hypothetical protein
MLWMISCGIMVRLIVCRRCCLIGLVGFWWKKQRMGWRVSLVVRVPLHGVVDFSRCRLLRSFCESWSIFFLDSKKMGQSLVRWSISLPWYRQYGGLTVYSAMTVAPVHWSAPLTVLIESLVGGPLVCLLWGCPIILLTILRWSISIRVDVVHRLRVAALAFIMVRSWGFVWLWNFSLLLKLAKVLNLGLAEFSKLFIELWHCFGPLSD